MFEALSCLPDSVILPSANRRPPSNEAWKLTPTVDRSHHLAWLWLASMAMTTRGMALHLLNDRRCQSLARHPRQRRPLLHHEDICGNTWSTQSPSITGQLPGIDVCSSAPGAGRRISQCYLSSTSAAASPRLQLGGCAWSLSCRTPGPCLSLWFTWGGDFKAKAAEGDTTVSPKRFQAAGDGNLSDATVPSHGRHIPPGEPGSGMARAVPPPRTIPSAAVPSIPRCLRSHPHKSEVPLPVPHLIVSRQADCVLSPLLFEEGLGCVALS